MYPRISDLINDVFGTDIKLPIQSYGFFVAMAFLVGGYLLYLELKRKGREGKIKPQRKIHLKGLPASTYDIVLSFVLGFITGFKLVEIILDYQYFADNPQEFLFSSVGNWPAGIFFGTGSAFYTWWAKRKKMLPKPVKVEETVHPQDFTGSIILVAAIAGIIGAKIFHQLENWQEFLDDPIGSLFNFSGLTFYGGLIVAAFAVVWYSEKNKINWKHLADAIAPSLMLAYGIGRIGCQVAGDGDWGIVNTAPKPEWLSWLPDWAWAYDYPHNVLRRGIPIEGCTGDYCFKLAETVYPTPIYETTISVIFFALLWSLRKRIEIPGVLFSLYLILNGVERFFVEKIRVNTEYHIAGLQITQAEIISVLLVVLGVAGIIYFKKTYKKELKT